MRQKSILVKPAFLCPFAILLYVVKRSSWTFALLTLFSPFLSASPRKIKKMVNSGLAPILMKLAQFATNVGEKRFPKL